MRDIFILKNKKDGAYIGFCDTSHPVSSQHADVIYVEATEDQHQKITSGWHPILDASNKITGVQKPQWLVDEENKLQQEQQLKQTIRQKLNNDTATVDDLKQAIKILLE